METRSKSELLDFKYRLVGFALQEHPTDSQKKIQFTFFEQIDGSLYLICLSELANNKEKRHRKILKTNLGLIVDAHEVIPFVQRSVNTDFKTFKEIVDEVISAAVWMEN